VIHVSAIVLAAGLSTRMGRMKPLLPFGRHTVIEQVVAALLGTAVTEVVVVTGHGRAAVEGRLADWPVRCVYNPDYAVGEMLSSIQAGMRAVSQAASAALIVLGDQPNLAPTIVTLLIDAYRSGGGAIIRPTFAGRPGHPVLIDRSLWPEVLALPRSASLRDVLRAHGEEVSAVVVETDCILRDMDTPEDYARELGLRNPENGQ
jgi:molybdenum cofactor cytidylyltransferase